jgi:sulfite exporter TauE/SafE
VQISLEGIGVQSSSRTSVALPHVFYNLGRVVSYSLIGAIAGMLGATALISKDIQVVVSIVLGSLMIVMGLMQSGFLDRYLPKKKGEGKIRKVLSTIVGSGGYESRFMIGLMTPLLPCGLLYGMAAGAAASLSPMGGALTMGAFAMGSIPALFATGMLGGTLGTRFRLFGTRFAVFLLISMGILTIGRGAGFYKGGPFIPAEKDPCCSTK